MAGYEERGLGKLCTVFGSLLHFVQVSKFPYVHIIIKLYSIVPGYYIINACNLTVVSVLRVIYPRMSYFTMTTSVTSCNTRRRLLTLYSNIGTYLKIAPLNCHDILIKSPLGLQTAHLWSSGSEAVPTLHNRRF